MMRRYGGLGIHGVGGIPLSSFGGMGQLAVPWYLAGGVAPLAAYTAKGAASYAASLVNLVNPGTYDLTETNGAITWYTGSGWSFVAAAAKELNTGIVPAVVGSQSPWTFFVQFANAANGTFMLFGNADGAAFDVYCIPNYYTRARYSNGSWKDNANLPRTAGNVAIAGPRAYYNGADEGVTLVAVSVDARTIWLGAGNDGAAGYYPFTGDIYGMAIYSSILTPTQIAQVSAAMTVFF